MQNETILADPATTKYQDASEMFRAHFEEIIELFRGDAELIVNYALTILVSALMTIRSGDKEQVLADLRAMFRHTENGMDSGALKIETLQ